MRSEPLAEVDLTNWLLLDDETFERNLFAQEPAFVSDSIEGIEAEAGFAAGVLQATVAQYNRHAAEGSDPLFQKEACWLRALDQPPYAVLDLRVESSPYSVFTLGGLHTRPGGEVLDAAGGVVAGLYAAGRTASGIPAQGYNSGLSIADCTFGGRAAGRSAAAAENAGTQTD